MDGWLKAVSPSDELRTWFGHDPEKWRDFQLRYFRELDQKPGTWQPLLQAAPESDLTLVFSAHDTQHNNAAVLRMYLIKRLKKRTRTKRPKLLPVHGELAFKRRLAVQTIRGNGFANGNSQGRLGEVLGRPLSPRVCRPTALDAREPRCSSF